jgi:ABC-type branched-subunit amino acid transport system substrate-binding protein
LHLRSWIGAVQRELSLDDQIYLRGLQSRLNSVFSSVDAMRKFRNDVTSISTVVVVVIIVIILVVAGAAGYLLLATSSTSTNSTSAVSTTSSVSSVTTSSQPVQTSSSGPETVVFGASLSLTGSAQAFGIEDNWTLHQAVNSINNLGGIPLKDGNHAKINLVILDDQSSDTISLNNYNTLLSTYHANVLMGQLGAIDDTIAANFASTHQVPIIGPYYLGSAKTCATPDCSTAWSFGTFHNETNEAHVFLNWFKTVDPPSSTHKVTIAFFEEADDSAQANYKAGLAYAQQLGYTACTCSDTNFQIGSTTEMQTFLSAAKSA